MKRFYSKVSIDAITGCHEWTACKLKEGYGQFRLGNKMKLAHRIAWARENGEIPEGMCVCHKCDNPSCVNPGHLFLGTHQDNMDDKKFKGRGNQPKGENNGSARITKEQALHVIQLLAVAPRRPNGRIKYGELQKIAEYTEISYQTVRNISAGNAWQHLTTEEDL
jgi:hypothetical protein